MKNPYMEDRKKEECKKPIPFFEIGIVLFMGFAGISYLLVDSIWENDALLRGLIVKVAPLYLWGVIQLIACVFLGLGLVLSKEWPRMIGLGLAFLIFLTYAISYFAEVRLVGGVYAINSLVCLLSIFYVHQTEL